MKTKVSYGQGTSSVLYDLEEDIISSYYEDHERLHNIYGGKQYYQSNSHLSAEGFLYPPANIIKISSYRTDIKKVGSEIRWEPDFNLKNNEDSEDCFLNIIAPVERNKKDHFVQINDWNYFIIRVYTEEVQALFRIERKDLNSFILNIQNLILNDDYYYSSLKNFIKERCSNYNIVTDYMGNREIYVQKKMFDYVEARHYLYLKDIEEPLYYPTEFPKGEYRVFPIYSIFNEDSDRVYELLNIKEVWGNLYLTDKLNHRIPNKLVPDDLFEMNESLFNEVFFDTSILKCEKDSKFLTEEIFKGNNCDPFKMNFKYIIFSKVTTRGVEVAALCQLDSSFKEVNKSIPIYMGCFNPISFYIQKENLIIKGFKDLLSMYLMSIDNRNFYKLIPEMLPEIKGINKQYQDLTQQYPELDSENLKSHYKGKFEGSLEKKINNFISEHTKDYIK